MTDLLVMVPTRGRRAQCERLLESFTATAGPDTDLLFITDPDNQDTYAGIDWGRASSAVLDPRDYLTGKLNKTAMAMTDAYDALMWLGDDCVPETPGWDKLMLATLEELGSGWVYPDDKRRSDVPEHWMVSSDVVKALGWFAPPCVQHFYCDNIIADLGKRAGLIRWCPEAVVRHEHYSVSKDTARDEVYQGTEEMFGASDLAAFQEWRSNQAKNEVSLLRRHFSEDVRWVLSRVLAGSEKDREAGAVLVAAGQQAHGRARVRHEPRVRAIAATPPAGAEIHVVMLAQDGQLRLAAGDGVLRVIGFHKP